MTSSDDTYRLGDVVQVRVLSGAPAERIVCGFSPYTGAPLFCTREETSRAAEDGRPAQGIGWPEEHVVGLVQAEQS